MEHLEEILHLFIATDQSKPIRAVQYIFYQKLPHYSVPEVPQAGDEGEETGLDTSSNLFKALLKQDCVCIYGDPLGES